MKARDRGRQRSQRRKDARVCVQCGTHSPLPGDATCESCLEAQAPLQEPGHVALRMARRRSRVPGDEAHATQEIAHCGRWHVITEVPLTVLCCGAVLLVEDGHTKCT